MPRAKGMSYDPGIGVALILRWPERIPAGQVRPELLSNVDVLPTLLEAANLTIPEGVQGKSFLGLLTGQGYSPRDDVFFEMNWHGRYNPMRGIRTSRYKYVRNFDGGVPLVYMPGDIYFSPSGEVVRDEYSQVPRPSEELYDLRADPWESRNLAASAETAEALPELRGKVDRWMEETGDPLLRGPIVPARGQAELLARAHEDGTLYLPPPAGAGPNPMSFTKGEWQAVQAALLDS